MESAISAHLSLWRDQFQRPRAYPPLPGDLEVDVAIVGGGITGLTAALLLKQAGHKVAVLEHFEIGSGTTGHTSCHMMSLLDTSYQDLVSKFGPEGASLARQSVQAAINQVEQFVQQLGIDCGFRRLPGFLYTEAQKDVAYLQQEAEAAHQAGLDASVIFEVPLPFPVQAALRVENQAEFNPMPYLHALAAEIQGGGSWVFEHSPVNELSDGEPCILRTEQGQVSAREVILATHTPLGLSLLQTMVAPYRSYVIGFRVEGAGLPQGLYWDTADPYHYLRSYRDATGEILLLGGADHKTGDQDHPNAPFIELESYAKERFRVSSVDYRWSSQYYVPADGLPYIGKGLGGSHVAMATGYNGDGIAFGTVAGILLADQAIGRSSPWSELYSPRRFKPLASAKNFVMENLKVAKDLVVDWLSRGRTSALDELRPGEGCILNLAEGKTAVCRDEAGGFHAVSAVCPHLKCIVHWNGAEKTWDCPCHGSRFSAQGEVLEGPALAPLEPRSVPKNASGGAG